MLIDMVFCNIYMIIYFNIQVHWLILDGSRNKLLVLTGQSSEDSGDLLLHTGQFSPHDFVQIFADEEVGLFQNPFKTAVLMFCECI